MYIHIFPKEKFTVAYINFINENFNKKDHVFFLHGSNDTYKKNDLNYEENVKDIESNKFIFLKHLYVSKKILIHSLFISRKLLVFLALQQKLLNKMTWIVWGGDLYFYRETKNNFKEKLIEYFRGKFIKNVGSIATLVREDYDLAVKWYKTKAKYFYAIYTKEEKTMNHMKYIRDKSSVKNEFISILVGNSATQTNMHEEIFDILKKYKDENIKIFCPLSYGDLNYAGKVSEKGKKIFGDKFIPLNNFMGGIEYIDFLNSIDIGVFNNNRQQGLGNICSLIYLGKKVYLRDKTSMWNELNDFLQLKIFSIEQLRKEDFDSFTNLSDTDLKCNFEHIREIYDEEKIKLLWGKIFILE